MAPPDPNRTYHANQALELSELVNLKFARQVFGTEERRILRVRELDGQSTDSGRKARQSIVLLREGTEDQGVVCGFVDIFKRSAELRGYSIIRQQYEARYGSDFKLTKNEYTRMQTALKEFFNTQTIDMRVSNVPRGPTQLATQPPKPTSSISAPGEVNPPLPYGLLLLSGALGFGICYILVLLGVFKG